MKEEFDLNKIRKEMPYQVPAGFFEEISAQTLAEAKRQTDTSKSFSIGSWRVLSVAASVAVLLIAGYLFFASRQNPAPEMAQVRPVATEAPKTQSTPEPALTPVAEDQPKVAVLPKPTRSATPLKQKEPAPATQTAKPEKTETLEELLATISDDDLQQLAALAESEEFVYGETIE